MVNHNTSAFAELAIRSLFANNSEYPLDLVVYDNDSNDADLADLQALTRRLGVPFRASGFPIDTANNSHGEILGRFVLDPATRDADYLLFLDSDICFTRPGVLTQLLPPRHRPDSLRRRTRPHVGRRNRDHAERLDPLHEPTTPVLCPGPQHEPAA